MRIAGLGDLTMDPSSTTDPRPLTPRPRPPTGPGGGGGSAQDGLSTIGQGSQTVGNALRTASQALGSGSGMSGTIMGVLPTSGMKKGGSVKCTEKHGFGKSTTGKLRNY